MKEFSLTEFAGFLGEIAEAHEANHHALEGACEIIEEESKRVLGTYDYGWDELAQATQENRVREGYTPNDPGLASGEMRDSIEHTVFAEEAFVGSDDQNLVWFNEGTSKQPARPVLDAAAMKMEEKVHDLIGRAMVAHLSGTALPKP